MEGRFRIGKRRKGWSERVRKKERWKRDKDGKKRKRGGEEKKLKEDLGKGREEKDGV